LTARERDEEGEKRMPAITRCGLVYTGKVAVITGGSKGIGAGCARVFVDAGAEVVICARGAEAGEELAKELTDKGPGTCRFRPCDVSKPEDIRRLIDRTAELYGRLDCLLNNAGYHPPHKAIDDFSLEEFLDVIQTNLVSVFVACRCALTHLRKTRGSIVNMGSLVGIMGQEAATTYCATKGAISAFTKALAIEETRHGVRINCVLPGNILTHSRTQGAATMSDPGKFEKWLDSHQPSGRSGTSEEVGQLCLFLASDAASYITGTEIIISSGSELGYGVKYPLSFV